MKTGITGIILAGGRSSRMGKDKGLTLLAGRPLVEHAIDILHPVVDTLLISTNNERYRYLERPLVEDIRKEIGPMGGIYSCLKRSKTEINFILSCDMPFLKPELFQILLNDAGEAWVVLPSKDGIYPEPMCGIYRKSVLPAMEEFIFRGNFKLPDLFREIPYKMSVLSHEQDVYSEKMFLNINSNEDIRLAEKILKEKNGDK